MIQIVIKHKSKQRFTVTYSWIFFPQFCCCCCLYHPFIPLIWFQVILTALHVVLLIKSFQWKSHIMVCYVWPFKWNLSSCGAIHGTSIINLHTLLLVNHKIKGFSKSIFPHSVLKVQYHKIFILFDDSLPSICTFFIWVWLGINYTVKCVHLSS